MNLICSMKMKMICSMFDEDDEDDLLISSMKMMMMILGVGRAVDDDDIGSWENFVETVDDDNETGEHLSVDIKGWGGIMDFSQLANGQTDGRLTAGTHTVMKLIPQGLKMQKIIFRGSS